MKECDRCDRFIPSPWSEFNNKTGGGFKRSNFYLLSSSTRKDLLEIASNAENNNCSTVHQRIRSPVCNLSVEKHIIDLKKKDNLDLYIIEGVNNLIGYSNLSGFAEEFNIVIVGAYANTVFYMRNANTVIDLYKQQGEVIKSGDTELFTFDK